MFATGPFLGAEPGAVFRIEIEFQQGYRVSRSKMQRKVQEYADERAPGVLRVGPMEYTRAVSHPDPQVGGLHPGSRLAADVEVLQSVSDSEVASILPERLTYVSYSGSPMTKYNNVWVRTQLEKVAPGTPLPETERAEVGEPGTAEGLPAGQEQPLAPEAPPAPPPETDVNGGGQAPPPSADGAVDAEQEPDGTVDTPDGETAVAGFRAVPWWAWGGLLLLLFGPQLRERFG